MVVGEARASAVCKKSCVTKHKWRRARGRGEGQSPDFQWIREACIQYYPMFKTQKFLKIWELHIQKSVI